MKCREAEQLVIPYINGELSMEKMQEFIAHVRECKNCSEELEVYFTIQEALDQLDKESDASYDIHQLLEENICEAEHQIDRARDRRFYYCLVNITAGIALVLSVIIQIGLWRLI